MDQCADERVKLVRTMIKNHYGTIPHVKPQVIRDMEQGTWYDTEAAQVLRNRQSTLKLSVRKDFVRVTVIEEKQLRDLPGSKASRSEKPQVPKRSATATRLLPAVGPTDCPSSTSGRVLVIEAAALVVPAGV
jgi:hypothetical protein